MSTPRSLAVLDIDGVVADARHRLHLLAGEPRHVDWVRFFHAAARDPLLAEGHALAHRLAVDHEIVWLTGRPDYVRDLTTRWLAKHDLPSGPLLMQPEADHRPARLVKLDHLRELAQRRRIGVVVDDDPRVVALLRAEGLPVHPATWSPWSPAFPPQEPDS
ncbi:phosphatase domain-containing protein [Streptoalloteichus hindustanus]|uniref:Polynucleotide kinase PNKP phosphatase domain-containing protein n=1 Tax=Streptoalloteichus hindustanus TaxID=2017 RepID=A0A1M5LDR9_STRHI|nr:hypothetical protein [Streptoalloteichus hindustanus]SHG63095.1 hypothetical protein SAMN05444320_11173 [Streptoalloteichus hindustanus]